MAISNQLAAAATMKASKLRDSLIEQADMARLSRVLVALKEDADSPLETSSWRDPARSLWPLSWRTWLYQPAQAPGRRTRQPGARHATEPGQGGDASAAPANGARRPPCPPSMWRAMTA
jgi:DNA polymerase-1